MCLCVIVSSACAREAVSVANHNCIRETACRDVDPFHTNTRPTTVILFTSKLLKEIMRAKLCQGSSANGKPDLPAAGMGCRLLAVDWFYR